MHVAGGLDTPERRNPDSNLGCQENNCFSRGFFTEFPNRVPGRVSIRCHQQERYLSLVPFPWAWIRRHSQ